MRAATLKRLQRKAATWNARYPVGTPVEYWTGVRGEGEPKRGRLYHPATIVGGSAVGWIDSCPGCVALSHVQPLTRIKCRTIHQPYASGFAHGLKTIETAGYPAEKLGLRSGDLLAIHAAKRPLTDEDWGLADRAGVTEFWQAEDGGCAPPFSSVLCVVRYLECAPVVRLGGLNETERALGDYSAGRYGWRTELVKTFPEPIPAPGRQGVFWWDAPEGVEL